MLSSDQKNTLTLVPDSSPAGFPGGGEMGELVRTKDWSRTPFGPIETWPQSLKTATSLMLESGFAMVVAWGPDFRFLYNDRYRPVLGNKHPASLGTPARDIFPEAWDNIIGPLFMRTRRGEAVAIDDFLVPLHRHGYLENCNFTISYSPIRDETGGIGGMLAVVAETTERVEGERRLATLRELARRAIDAKTPPEACLNAAAIFRDNLVDVPFALLYLLDGDGTKARRVATSGLDRGHPAAAEIIDLANPTPGAWPLGDALRAGQACVIPDVKARFGPLPSGPFPEPVHSAMVLPLARPGLAVPYGFLVIGTSARRPFNERYRDFLELAAEHITTAIANASALEEERRRADALAEIDRTKTAFFSNVSHEFRTPLTLMIGPIEEMLAADQLPTEARRQLELTHRNSLRLLKLVNTLLDFSRLEAGRLQARFEPVDLPAFTAELAGVFRAAIEKAGLRLRVECEPAREPAYVDRDLWEKIVFNLLSNALKFTLRGEIAVRVRHAEGQFELALSDTGVGIPERELPNLFKRFHRIENERSRTHEGTGIGLALVQELVGLHRGVVRVSSQPGVGTTFTVTLPAGRAHLPEERVDEAAPRVSTRLGARSFIEEAMRWLPDDPAPPPPAHTPAPPSPHPAFTAAPLPARIVLADDNADMRDYVRRLLGVSYAVEAVPDGEAALAAIRRQRPDLVLTDIMMPRLDGFGLLRAIRADAGLRTLPVIMLSARAGNEANAEGYEAGADDYLIKPFTARDLMARVASHLTLARLRGEAVTHAEQARQGNEANRRLAAIVQGSDDAIIAKDLTGIITHWNPGAERIFGYTAAEIVGRSILTIIPVDRRHEEPEILRRLQEGERVEHFETIRRHRDGRLVNVSLTVSPVRDEAGKVVGASKIARDITARRRAELQQQALYELVTRVNRAVAPPEIYDAALDAVRHSLGADRAAILLCDAEGIMRFTSWRGLSDAYRQAAEGHSPWKPDDADPASFGIEDVSRSSLDPALRAVIEREGIRALAFIPLRYERRLLGKFMLYYDHVHAFPALELQQAGTIAGQVAFAIERRRAADALETLVGERTALLRKAIEQMEEFSYSVSHDLRSPVRAMRGYAEALLVDHGPRLGEEARELLGRILRNGSRMDRLIQDLLTYSRLARREVQVEPVSLDRLVREMIQHYPEMDPAFARIDIHGPLPDVMAHEPSLTQAVSNLLTNAVKFVPAGTRPHVQVGCERTATGIRLWVQDNGIGIKPEYQGRLFGMFERVHPDQKFEGTGIGLAIVRKAMERMNGTAGVVSDGTAGSRFWIELPAAPP